MADDIEDFIRRAAARRKQATPAQKRKSNAGQPTAQPQQQQRQQRPRLAQPEIVEAEVIEATVVDSRRGLNTSQFEQRASQFGEQPGLADDKLESHLHQTFDHQVGRLSKSTMEAAEIVNTQFSADLLPGIIAALRTPSTARQAILVAEILARPEHRW